MSVCTPTTKKTNKSTLLSTVSTGITQSPQAVTALDPHAHSRLCEVLNLPPHSKIDTLTINESSSTFYTALLDYAALLSHSFSPGHSHLCVTRAFQSPESFIGDVLPDVRPYSAGGRFGTSSKRPSSSLYAAQHQRALLLSNGSSPTISSSSSAAAAGRGARFARVGITKKSKRRSRHRQVIPGITLGLGDCKLEWPPPKEIRPATLMAKLPPSRQKRNGQDHFTSCSEIIFNGTHEFPAEHDDDQNTTSDEEDDDDELNDENNSSEKKHEGKEQDEAVKQEEEEEEEEEEEKGKEMETNDEKSVDADVKMNEKSDEDVKKEHDDKINNVNGTSSSMQIKYGSHTNRNDNEDEEITEEGKDGKANNEGEDEDEDDFDLDANKKEFNEKMLKERWAKKVKREDKMYSNAKRLNIALTYYSVGEPSNDFGRTHLYKEIMLASTGGMKELYEFVKDVVKWRRQFVRPGDSSSFELLRYKLSERGHGDWQSDGFHKARDPATVILSRGMLEQIFKDAHAFYSFDTRDWYRKHGLPHRRSYLFHGPPGTGKTSTIRVLAGELQLTCCFLQISGYAFTNQSLSDAFKQIPKNSLLVIEDVDSLFNSARESKMEGQLTFSGLLNVLDGLMSADGLMTILTTNHVKKLDNAMIRGGRIDRAFLFDVPGQLEVKRYFCSFYPHCKPTDLLVKQFVDIVWNRKELDRARNISTLQQLFIAARCMNAKQCVENADDFFDSYFAMNLGNTERANYVI